MQFLFYISPVVGMSVILAHTYRFLCMFPIDGRRHCVTEQFHIIRMHQFQFSLIRPSFIGEVIAEDIIETFLRYIKFPYTDIPCMQRHGQTALVAFQLLFGFFYLVSQQDGEYYKNSTDDYRDSDTYIYDFQVFL